MPTPRVSFEVFPPQSLAASFRLWETLQDLAPLAPDYVSVTYGAGGATRKLTQEAVALIGRRYGLDVSAHLTCVGATKAETMAVAEGFAEAGVRDIVALRGDAPEGEERFTPHPEGFASSVALIEALAATGRFNLRVGAYPERHPDAADDEADVRWLKRKIDAGASSAIAQFVFDPEIFLRFRDRCVAAGIDAPVVPGILPIQDWAATRKFADRCGASIPRHLAESFDTATRDGRTDSLALAQCTALCARLVEEGVQDLHFYTLNKSHLTRQVCHALGIRHRVALEKVA